MGICSVHAGKEHLLEATTLEPKTSRWKGEQLVITVTVEQTDSHRRI